MSLGGEFARSWGYIPPFGVAVCAVASSFIPLAVYKINQSLHKHGDPPWKTGKEQEEREE